MKEKTLTEKEINIILNALGCYFGFESYDYKQWEKRLKNERK